MMVEAILSPPRSGREPHLTKARAVGGAERLADCQTPLAEQQQNTRSEGPDERHKTHALAFDRA
jgi:hypothetical protein